MSHVLGVAGGQESVLGRIAKAAFAHSGIQAGTSKLTRPDATCRDVTRIDAALDATCDAT